MAIRGPRIRAHARRLLDCAARAVDQRYGSGAACRYDRLLCPGLHGMAQALERAQYRHWRGSRGDSADDRLGRSDWRPESRAVVVVPHHLLLDAASFLGPLAL